MKDVTNAARAARAENLIRVYALMEERLEELGRRGCTETLLSDVLADLMHYAGDWHLDFERAVRIAAMHYDAELLDEEGAA